MPIKVLVVDDSSFFRRRITEIIGSDKAFKVVGQGTNGKEAIELAVKLAPDIITMDYEMPALDGISAVKEIMKRKPTAILMFSSLTYEGARTTLDALEAGAKDFLPKSFESVSGEVSVGSNELLMRLRAIAKVSGIPGQNNAPVSEEKTLTSKFTSSIMNIAAPKKPDGSKPNTKPPPRSTQGQSSNKTAQVSPTTTPRLTKCATPDSISRQPSSTPSPSRIVAPQSKPVFKKGSIKPKLCVIGSSTGGPMALQAVLKCLPAASRMPIVIAQHMPAAFTEAFADRLDTMCNVQVFHGKNGDRLQPGCVYIAPGGMQTIIKDSTLTLSVLKGDDRLNYKPSVDLTFASAATACPGKVLAIVLTGMGSDGADGARLLKQGHSEVWIQDEQSCVVFGMPQAVMKQGYYDDMMSIDQVGPRLAEVAISGCT